MKTTTLDRDADNDLGSEDLAPDLQAMLDLRREAEGPTSREWLRDRQGTMVLLGMFLGWMALRAAASGPVVVSSSEPLLAFGYVVAFVMMLHAESENMARRRLKLVLEVLRDLRAQRQREGQHLGMAGLRGETGGSASG